MALHRQGYLDLQPSIVASAKVLEESATPDVQCTFAPGSFKGGQIGELEETPGLSAGARGEIRGSAYQRARLERRQELGTVAT